MSVQTLTGWLVDQFSRRWLLSRFANRLFGAVLCLVLGLMIVVSPLPSPKLSHGTTLAILIAIYGAVTVIGIIFLHVSMLAFIKYMETEPARVRRWNYIVSFVPIFGAVAYYVFRYHSLTSRAQLP